jgi:predicted nucleic acid-binding Zn ribbon protein
VIVHAIAPVLNGLLRDLGLESEVVGWRAVSEWPEAVGARIARRARAVSFHQGTLVVEVEGSAWMQELGFLKRQMLRQLECRLGGPHVRRLRFVMAPGGIRR